MSMSKLHKAVVRGDLVRLQSQIMRLGKQLYADDKTDAPATEFLIRQLSAAALDVQTAIEYMER